MPEEKQFIQIGPDIINNTGKGDIVRLHIGLQLEVVTRDINTIQEGYPENHAILYDLNSPEAKAILSWINEQTIVLVHYKEKIKAKENTEEAHDHPF
jgi:hypothetical protein